MKGKIDMSAEVGAVLQKPLPVNKDTKEDKHKDMLLIELDCTVMEYMHSRILDAYNSNISERGFSEFQVFDSTRGVFTEGGPAFYIYEIIKSK